MSLMVCKSRARDGRDPGYGGYMVADRNTNAVVCGAHPYAFAASLDEVEHFFADDSAEVRS